VGIGDALGVALGLRARVIFHRGAECVAALDSAPLGGGVGLTQHDAAVVLGAVPCAFQLFGHPQGNAFGVHQGLDRGRAVAGVVRWGGHVVSGDRLLQDAVDFAQFFGKVNRFTKKMDEFSQRLREERKRLGLSQEAFASLGGVSKNTQSNYETGANLPDVGYLNTIRGFGVDSGYVLTGIRTFDPSAIEHAQPAATLAARLVQERKRLELTVGQLAAKSGVDRLALLKFEEGEFAPDAKALQQLHAVGVDVGYVLLSLRAGAAGGDVGVAGAVSADIEVLMQHYGKATAEGQAAIRTVASLAAQAARV